MATAVASWMAVLELPKRVWSLPSVLKEVSGVPSALKRARAKLLFCPVISAQPATTILPSSWMATARAYSLLSKWTVALPSVLKVVSSSPSAV